MYAGPYVYCLLARGHLHYRTRNSGNGSVGIWLTRGDRRFPKPLDSGRASIFPDEKGSRLKKFAKKDFP